MMKRALIEFAFFPNSQRGLSKRNGVNISWNKAMTEVNENIQRHCDSLAN
jgi:hypothetical protein